jgi:hypothetical protein
MPRPAKRTAMRIVALCALLLTLVGCREVRVKTYAQGRTTVPGGNRIAVVRDRRDLESFGIHAAVRFNHEFGVLLLMGPHRTSGWHQYIESIRANASRVRIVAFERAPLDGGEATETYRTYTLWIVPNSVYRVDSILDVVTPEGDPIASTVLK